MKTQIRIFAFIALVALMSSCYHPYFTIVGSGPVITQEFTVGEFSAVAGETVIDIDIVQGSVQKVV
nr:hypothetical protein [Prolixibacteraceae bacterium]